MVWLRRPLFRTEQTPRPPGLALGFLAAYALTTGLAYAWTTGAGGLAVLWLGNGIVAVSLLLLPRATAIRLSLVCATGDFLSALLTGTPPARSAFIAGGDLIEAYLAAMLIRQVGGAALDVTSVRRFSAIAFKAVLPATLLVGSAAAVLTHRLFDPQIELASLWITWALGDFLGMMIGVPTALILARFSRFDLRAAAGPIERIGLLVALAAVTALVFLQDATPVAFLVFPVTLLVVLRVNPPFAAAAVMVVAVVAAAATVTGRGPFDLIAVEDLGYRILLLQVFLASILFSAFTLSGLLAQRQRAMGGLRRALQAAHRAREAAVRADGSKSRFLAVMSHEMRTPLNGVAGYAQLLQDRADIPPDAREQIRMMHASARVLLDLIGDILDYSRGELGEVKLDSRPFDLSALLERSVAVVRPTLDEAVVTLRLDASGVDQLWVLGDERRLAQVVLNLIGNAVKFTPAGGVDVVATQAPVRGSQTTRIRIEVRDTGVGVPSDKLESVFEAFTQVDSSASRTYEGVGLGLAISRSLIEAMGGRIGATSEVGKGSTFWIEALFQVVESVEVAGPEPLSPPIDNSFAVLVVDDHPVNRQVASLMLTAAGFAVEAVEDGGAAVEAVRSGAFDLVFMDVHMPGMDGLEATRVIRSLEGPASATPIIAMTAAALPEDVERCLASGMNGHIAKPINQTEIIETALRSLMGPAQAA